AEEGYRIAQATNRAKDEFLMTLSHELRTPLTAILGWSRLLTSMPPNDPTFRDALNAIGRSAQVQARLIDDVLDVSRIMSGKLRLELENVDIVRVLNAAVDAVRPSAEAKNISIATSYAPQLGSIVADATRVQQIVWNLLSNAVKFTQKGGTVTLSARRSSSHVQISVVDTGEGIDTAFLPHIFEPFRQAESPTTRIHGGLGLGLSIVRYLVEAHGGTIAAESQGRGSGATFTITLPFAALKAPPPPLSEVAAPATAAAGVAKLLTGVSILLVDDDPEGRRMVQAVLRTAGAEVTDAESAQATLDALAVKRFDIVVSDIALPGVDGYQLARMIREQYRGLKIVALTAFSPGRSGDRDDLFDGYIVKPVEPNDLVTEVANLLKR
ncbi:MAG TPA: ATP-binding protein, partial [Thermoanaerobaculia bacterium]